MSENGIIREIRKKAVGLTLALYRVTALFPKEEPLRWRLRQAADDILGDIVEFGYYNGDEKIEKRIAAKIEVINALLEVAREIGLTHPLNFSVLVREYSWLSDFCAKLATHKESSTKLYTWNNFVDGHKQETSPKRVEKSTGGLNNRQKAIIEHLKSAGEARISDFFKKFQGISSRTIQRDLQDLVARDLLKREGEKRWTTYTRVV